MLPAIDLFPGFQSHRIEVEGGTIFARSGGNGPPLLLLHGYPQTHVEWHTLAPRLAEHYTVVLMDLRGYGASFLPPTAQGGDAAAMSKRAMGRDAIAVMQALGHTRFRLVGHDRGGRVAYRLAYDHPERLEKVAVIDIIPTAAMFHGMDKAKSAMNKYHWLFLAQPAPFPETLIGASASFYLDHTLSSWTRGKDLSAFHPAALAHYHAAFTPDRIHTSCEDYRAGLLVDRVQDEDDLAAGRKIGVPMLVMWGESGIPASGLAPVEVWRDYAADVQGAAVAAGHFVPEENPQACADALLRFLR